MCQKRIAETMARITITLWTDPNTPLPSSLILRSSEGFRIRAWTLDPFSPGSRGSKLYRHRDHVLKPTLTEAQQHWEDLRLWLTPPLSMYLLMARLRRIASPRRYRTVNTNTENERKRREITPSTMAVVACLMTDEGRKKRLFDDKSKCLNYLKCVRLRGATYPEMANWVDPTQSLMPGP